MHDWNTKRDQISWTRKICCWNAHGCPLTMFFFVTMNDSNHDPSPGAFSDLVKEECDPQVGTLPRILEEFVGHQCIRWEYRDRSLEDGPSKSSLGFWMDDVSSRKNVVFLFYDHWYAMTTFLTSPSWWTTLWHSHCVMTSLNFFMFFLNTSGRSKILDLQKETLMWHANFRTHAQLLGDCGQLTSKDEGPTAVVLRCVFLSEKKHRPCGGGSCLWLFLLPRGVQQESGRLDI